MALLRHREFHEGALTEMYQGAIDNVALAAVMLETPIHKFLQARPLRPCYDPTIIKKDADLMPWLPPGIAYTELVC